MIEFACPGCTKPLEANRAFAGFETRCLRCGTVIRIPPKSGDAAPTLTSAGLPKPRRAAASQLPQEPDDSAPEQESGLEPGPASATATLEEPPLAKRRSLKAEREPEPVGEAPAEAPPVVATGANKRKKQKIIGGSAAGAILVIVLLVVAFSGKSPKPALKNDTPAPAPKKEEQPPPPKKEEPKKVVVYEPAPMPRAVRPAVEYELTAAALLLEYGEAPPAADLKYDGKDLLIRGVFHSYSLGKVTLVPNEEKSTPLSFTLLPPVEFRTGELLPNPGLTPGQPVVLRGTYRTGCRFTEATVEVADSPADKAFLNKSVCLDGAVIRSVNSPTGSVPFPSLTLEPPATDSKFNLTCYFKSSDLDEVMRLKPGQRIDIRGRCSGRSYASVRLDNCAIVTPENAPGSEVTRLPADAFFTECEADLLAYPRVNLKNPAIELMPVTAEGLGHAYQVDPRSANLTYRNKAVQLSGYVKEKHAATRMLVLQCGTDSAYSVAAVFSPRAFDALPEDRNVVVRGVCSGVSGGYIRVDSAESAETGGATALRTDVEFLPYRLGKEHIVDQITPSNRKDCPIKRMAIRFGGDDMIQIALLKQGTFPGTSLLRDPLPEPKWTTYIPKLPPQVRRYRVRDGVVEIGQPFVAGEKKEEFWEPIIKSALKKGQSWSVRFPDGKMATYTVMNLTKVEGKPEQLETKRTLRDPMDPTRWEETGSTYVRGVGEVRRIITARTDRNEAVVLSETRLVTDGAPPAELKTDPKK